MSFLDMPWWVLAIAALRICVYAWAMLTADAGRQEREAA